MANTYYWQPLNKAMGEDRKYPIKSRLMFWLKAELDMPIIITHGTESMEIIKSYESAATNRGEVDVVEAAKELIKAVEDHGAIKIVEL